MMNTFADFHPLMMQYEDLLFPFLRSHRLDHIEQLINDYKYQPPQLIFSTRLAHPYEDQIIVMEGSRAIAATKRYCTGIFFYETVENNPDNHFPMRIISSHHLNVTRSRLMKDIQNLGKVEWFNWYPLYQKPKPFGLESHFPGSSYLLVKDLQVYPIYHQINWMEELVGKRLRKNTYQQHSKYSTECPICGYSTFCGVNPYCTAIVKDTLQCHHYLTEETSAEHITFLLEISNEEADKHLSRIINLVMSFDDLNTRSTNVHPVFQDYDDIDDNFQLAQDEPFVSLAMERATAISMHYLTLSYRNLLFLFYLPLVGNDDLFDVAEFVVDNRLFLN